MCNGCNKRGRKVNKTEKEQLVSSLRQALKNASVLVVTKQSGLTVAEVSDLRTKMRSSGASYKVMKNTLVKLALKDTQFEGVSHLFAGPTALAFSQDPVAAARIAVNFAKDNEKIEVIGGSLGDKQLDKNGVKALAALPSLDELRAKIIGMVTTPATRIAQIMSAPAGQIARVIAAHSNK